MSAISKIRLFNFKAFSNETEIDLDGNHLLMYGENGSGKSSIYWALYTLMQSSTKNQADIQKYFTPNNKEHLINYHLVENQSSIDPTTGEKIIPQSIGLNSFAEIELENGDNFKIDSQGLVSNVGIGNLQNLNKFSDFVSHRLLINFYNFRNSKKINLWEVFVRDIFPFVSNQRGNGAITLSQVLKEIETSKPFKLHDDGRFTLSKSSALQDAYDTKIAVFNEDLSHWIAEINTLVNTFYTKHFQPIHSDNIKISLKYSKKLEFRNGHPQFYTLDNRNYERWYNYVGFNFPEIDLKIETLNADGTYTEMSRPQSYFNEAKLTSIALSVRFSLLDDSIRPDFAGQFLALDDLLVSMDMSNRDKVLDILLDEYASKYKIYLFTHEKSFFDFCMFKIEQRKKKKEWEIMEIHSGENKTDNPVLITSGLNYYDKAIKYFQTKDYTTSSLYLRKELEKLIIDRIPDEFSKTIDNQYHNLEHYWKLFVERYCKLKLPISQDIQNNFKQSKLMILNPEAHHNLELMVYKLELEKAFALVRDIYDNYPIPLIKILFSKGMKLQFRHPTENYTFDFELLTDFCINNLDAANHISIPKCRIISWQYNNIEFWDVNDGVKIPEKPIEQKLNQIKSRHIANIAIPFNIDSVMFDENINIENSIWSFKEIIDKAGIVL